MDVKARAASILGGKTDIMTRNCLRVRFKKADRRSRRADFLMT